MIDGHSSSEKAGAENILDLLMGLWKAGVVKAALELDLFTQIAQGHQTSNEIAVAMHSSERGTTALLDALCGLGLLHKSDHRYGLSPEAGTYLSKTSPSYIHDLHLGIAAPWEWKAFGRLADAVREGKATIGSYMQGEEESCLEKMVLAIGTVGLSSAARICDLLEVGSRERKRFNVLDIACGSGVYGFTMAQREPSCRVTSIDRRRIIRLAQKIAEQMAVTDQITFRPGNIFSLNYPAEEYDLVLISNVLHQYPSEQARKLFEKAYTATRRPDGMIVVHDFVADDGRCRETSTLLMGVDMLLYTDAGDVHTYSEYKAWLEGAGFKDVTGPVRIPGNFTSIMTAIKN